MDVIVSGTEVDGIHVEFKDFVFAAEFFDVAGHQNLGNFAGIFLFLGKVHDASKLLCDGAATFYNLTIRQISP